jgi:hypothetical protein
MASILKVDQLQSDTGTVTVASNIALSGTSTIFGNIANPTITGTLNLTGGQIKFPASRIASADANTLDDYEEGTFTPSFAGLTVGNGTLYGYYTKIGNVVAVNLGIVFGSTTSWASVCTGIGGLPFALNATPSQAYATLVGQSWDSGSGWTGMHAGMSTGNASLNYPLSTQNGGTVTSSTPFTWTTNDSLNFNGTYLT